MKEIHELILPEELRYEESHEWVKIEGENARIGITDYAQSQLGDIVFVELPGVGDALRKGKEFGTVESVKAVAELYSPLSGEVLSINEALMDEPELLNKDPYNEGWMVEIRLSDAGEADSLMGKDEYMDVLKGQE
jgi:glycine cleavage system H protein